MNNNEGLISIISPSPNGKKIVNELESYFNICRVYQKEEGVSFSLKEVTQKAFLECNKIIFVSSTGIAVRAISSLLNSKDKDPAVVVVDLCRKYSISLVSGHLGGANELAMDISNKLGTEAIITTATDNMGIVAPDMIAKKYNLTIDNLKTAKHIAALLVNKDTVYIKDDFGVIKDKYNGYTLTNDLKENCVWITNSCKSVSNNILKLLHKNIVIGVGCRRNTDSEKMSLFIKESLNKYGFDLRSIVKVVSVELKKDERCIIDFAREMQCEFKTFTIDEIKKVQDKYDGSNFVLKSIGVKSVCEPCVDLSSAEIVVSKIKHDGMTLAIGILNTK